MNITKKNRYLLVCISVIVSLLSSCIPVMDYGEAFQVRFKNCTNDTLFIGASHYNDIDSVYYQLNPIADFSVGINTKNISLWNNLNNKNEFKKNTLPDYYEREVVLPDSLCGIKPDILFLNSDTCYFFLIKYEDDKNNSWDEIRAKKLYKKWKVVRKKYGGYDRNIRYSE